MLVGLLLNSSFLTPAVPLDIRLQQEYTELSNASRQAMSRSLDELRVDHQPCLQLKTSADLRQGSEGKIFLRRVERLCGVYDYVLRARQNSAAETK